MPGGYKAFDIGKLRAGIVAYEERITSAAIDAVEETVAEGAKAMEDIIVASTTRTGEERAARGGGLPGRIDSGRMYGDVSTDLDLQGDTIVGRWGWTEDFEDYYGYQDQGTGKVAGMNALGGSFIRAVDRIKARLSRITR